MYATGTTDAHGHHGTALLRADVVRAGHGAPCYRIPALAQLPDGRLLAVCDARPDLADLPGPIGLVACWSDDAGRTWTPPTNVRAASPPYGFGDPSIVVDEVTGRILVFHVGSAGAGFFTGRAGLDPDDPAVTHPDVSVSDDGGRTWTHRRLTRQLREPGWAGMFASSGAGIQLRQGRYAGRLLQQYTVRVEGENFAMTAYSDDHGETWRHSDLVGPGADENKVVELGDGSVLLNCRATPCRTQARSYDGGVTWEALTPQPELPDPGNNGSVIRAFPDAAPGSPRSRILLCSNTADPVARRHLTVKMSYDDGATWPGRLLVHEGPAAYSTMINLAEGSYGLLFERDGYQALTFTCFDFDDLHGLDAELTVEPTGASFPAGERSRLPMRLRVREPAAGPIELEAVAPPGWRCEPEPTTPASGAAVTLDLWLTPARGCAGRLPLTLLAHSGDRLAAHDIEVDVAAAGPLTLQVAADPVVDTVERATSDGPITAGVWVPVRNLGNCPAHVEVWLADGRPVSLDLAPGELGVARGSELRCHVLAGATVDVGVRASADGADDVEQTVPVRLPATV